jgi:predicted molibdopterin-dependent oxidoreductase YjgC
LSNAPTRIEDGVSRPAAVEIQIDGEPATAFPGESLAAALLASGRRVFRVTNKGKELRGPYCNMGVCFDCIVEVDGVPVQACMTPVSDGMRITTAVSID